MRCKVGEVEAEYDPFAVQGACLLNVVAQYGAQRLLQQVGGAVCARQIAWRYSRINREAVTSSST